MADLGGGIQKFVAMPDYAHIAIARDSLLFEGVLRSTNKMEASFNTPAGRRQVSCEKYMEVVNALRPDLYAALPDEVEASVSQKRNVTSVTRTVEWLDKCLRMRTAYTKDLLGVVVGGGSVTERRRSALETVQRPVAGFQLAGFGLGESPEERPSLLQAAIEVLPSEKVRHITGLGMPEEVLQGVAQGLDLFDSTYPHHLTVSGYALIFPLRPGEGEYKTQNRDDSKSIEAWEGLDSMKINLRSLSNKLNRAPLLEGCCCYTCRSHTRAYLHHLLNTHEMLAEVLLNIHNTHHYLEFFQNIRKSILEGKFDEYKNWFLSRRKEGQL